MHYHKGLIRQQGHGLGALLGIASKVAGPLISGLLGGAPAQQQQQQQRPVYQERYYDYDRPYRSYQRRRRRSHPTEEYDPESEKQKGKGFFTDLLKSGAKSALKAAAKTGMDVLDNKRSLKDALKTHGAQALKETAGYARRRRSRKAPSKRGRKARTGILRKPGTTTLKRKQVGKQVGIQEGKGFVKRKQRILARGGPHKRPRKQPRKRSRKGGRKLVKRGKPKRSLDIFD